MTREKQRRFFPTATFLHKKNLIKRTSCLLEYMHNRMHARSHHPYFFHFLLYFLLPFPWLGSTTLREVPKTKCPARGVLSILLRFAGEVGVQRSLSLEFLIDFILFCRRIWGDPNKEEVPD